MSMSLTAQLATSAQAIASLAAMSAGADQVLRLDSQVRAVACPRCRALARRMDSQRLEFDGVESYWALCCTGCGLEVGDDDELQLLAGGLDCGVTERRTGTQVLRARDPNRWLSFYSPSDAVSVEARHPLERAHPMATSRGIGVSVAPCSSTHGLTPQPDEGRVSPNFWSDPMNQVLQLFVPAAALVHPVVPSSMGDVPLYFDSETEIRVTFWREFISWLQGAQDHELDQLEAVLLDLQAHDLLSLKVSVHSALALPAFTSRLPASLVRCMEEANWPLRRLI